MPTASLVSETLGITRDQIMEESDTDRFIAFLGGAVKRSKELGLYWDPKAKDGSTSGIPMRLGEAASEMLRDHPRRVPDGGQFNFDFHSEVGGLLDRGNVARASLGQYRQGKSAGQGERCNTHTATRSS
ncbi:hypothetical protein [Arthrobacter rhombi]|uniref:hypothetical protein n=1 Tax=Arthrobacter rhombi TaxID=71253 RepID=UPI0031D8AF9B